MPEHEHEHEQDYETEVSFGTAATTEAPSPPGSEVIQKQDPGHTEADFLRDLGKATQRKPAAS
jgi:hypothetical protein